MGNEDESLTKSSHLVMREGLLQREEGTLRCLRMGEGKELIVAFHGFGQQAEDFYELAQRLSAEYTLIALDFPGSNAALWPSKRPPIPKTLWYYLQKILDEFGVEQLHLLGYSLGARMAMVLTEYYPEKVKSLILLAPDGLKRSGWYGFLTRNLYGKWIFNQVLRHPQKWLKRANWLMDKGWPHPRWRGMVNHALGNENYLNHLRTDWPFTRYFIPNTRYLKKVIRKFKLPVWLFMGEHDQVIPIEQGKKWIKGMDEVHFYPLNEGHQLLRSEKALAVIAAAFNSEF